MMETYLNGIEDHCDRKIARTEVSRKENLQNIKKNHKRATPAAALHSRSLLLPLTPSCFAPLLFKISQTNKTCAPQENTKKKDPSNTRMFDNSETERNE
jgi:hypothetical protein